MSRRRKSRLRRSLKRLGYELADADGGKFDIRHQGRMCKPRTCGRRGGSS